MVAFSLLSVVTLSIFGQLAATAKTFAGSNLYYAAGLTTDQRTTLLKGLQSAGMKVLRVWLDGQQTAQKGTGLDPFPDLEASRICNGDESCYDNTVLERLDAFMVDAQSYGIKLIISMHSFNALQAGDVYGRQYGTGYFYEQDAPQQAFDKRIVHILNHNHTTLGRPWKQLKEYIFGFEAENEAMIGKGEAYIQAHQYWQCDRAKTIKGQLGDNSGILVVTGGESWVHESVQSDWLNCDAIDVISLHAYGVGDFSTSSLQPYVDEAKKAGKLMMMQEWGACYFNTENNNCPRSDTPLDVNTRNTNIKNWAGQITAAGLPWLYWQVLPNADPHEGYDYEIGIGEPSWATLQSAAKAAASGTGPFDFSPYLL
ncbi:glycoside hydrolase family 5 protein [Fomes fomentarius]|nr:glycoside hydrolase family 5 protein [Fomes fomentarius]